MKYAAGVTLYNPTDAMLLELNKLALSFEKVFLFDNSDQFRVQDRYKFDNCFEILSEGDNKGLPYAFNSIIKRCEGYDFLCTLDQDSVFDYEDIISLQEYICSLNDLDSVGIVAPLIDYGRGACHLSKQCESAKWVITSGSFLNLSVFRKEQLLYDGNYFIDRMEVDMCMQLTRLGYNVIVYHGSILHQSLGDSERGMHVSHSVLRHYYIFRNRFYFNNKWYSGKMCFFLNISQTLRHVFSILMYEQDKISKLSSLKDAYRDYLKGSLGRRDDRKKAN